VPFRHVPTWFDAAREEQHALLELAEQVKRMLDRGVTFPDGSVRVPDGLSPVRLDPRSQPCASVA
jgi:hypothetical protein